MQQDNQQFNNQNNLEQINFSKNFSDGQRQYTNKPPKTINKKVQWIIVAICLLAIIGISFYIYYSRYALGTLVIKSTTPEVNIKVFGQEYENINELEIKLPPFQHNVQIYKEGCLTQTQLVDIKALRKNVLEVELLKAEHVGNSSNVLNYSGLAAVSGDDIYLLDYSQNRVVKITEDGLTTLVEFDFLDDMFFTEDNVRIPRGFYRSNIDSYSWVKNNQAQVVGLVLSYEKDEKIINKYLNLQNGEILDIGNNLNSVRMNENLTFAYFSEDEDSLVLETKDLNNNVSKNIIKTDELIPKIEWLDNNHIIYISLEISEDNKIFNKIKIINLNTKQIQELEFSDAEISNFVISPEKDKILVISSSDQVKKATVVNLASMQKQEINDIKFHQNFVDFYDNNNLAYISSTTQENKNQDDKLVFNINKFNLENHNNEQLYQIKDYFFDFITDFTIGKNTLYLIMNNQIIRFNKK